MCAGKSVSSTIFIRRTQPTCFVRAALAPALQIRDLPRAGRRQNRFDFRPAMFIVGELLDIGEIRN
jgi:hypothetical protein